MSLMSDVQLRLAIERGDIKFEPETSNAPLSW